MPTRLTLLVLLTALVAACGAVTPARSSAAAGSPPECARTAPGDSHGSGAGLRCWTDVKPYPFGGEGTPVDPSSELCAPGSTDEAKCYLTVTSMAFRAWNRGLAATVATATAAGGERAKTPYGLWIFNGTRWFPDETFPGQGVCSGTRVVWAGKLDYWLVGGPSWARLCRFDGASLAWEPLPLPEATLLHATPPGETKPAPGSITSAACFAWNDCWFFGTYGAVVQWDGKELHDRSPDRRLRWLAGEYTAALALQDESGNSFGVAVGATDESLADDAERTPKGVLPAQPDEAPPPQMRGSSGGPFAALPFTPVTIPRRPEDLYRTDLVALGFDAAGQGWVAGNPAGVRTELSLEDPQLPSGRFLSRAPQPAPLVPLSAAGTASGCEGPPEARFVYSGDPKETETAGAFLWGSLAVIPSTGEALAGGRMRRATAGAGRDEDAIGEPVIVRADCHGHTEVTRFRISDPTEPTSETAADRGGTVTALAANATNDAWAATTSGFLKPAIEVAPPFQPPHLYRLTDGQAPAAPEGDDLEERPVELQADKPPIYVLEPPVEAPPSAAPPTITRSSTITLPPAVYGVKVRLRKSKRNGHEQLSLYLTFKLHRPVTLGAEALRHGRIVSVAPPRRFTGRTGTLVLNLDRKRWPTKVGFIT